MIKNSSQIVITIEEQIKLLERRLLLLQNEITSNKKTYEENLLESNKIIKERDYQIELLEKFKTEVSVTKMHLDKLKLEVVEANNSLDRIQQEGSSIQKHNNKQSEELKAREDKLLTKEGDFLKEVADFNIKSNQLSKEQAIVKKAKDALSKAIEQITW